jgi:acetyl esterase/lipase
VTALEWRIARSLLRRPPSRHAYGAHAHQTCDLHLPAGRGPHPVAVVLHGGYWQAPYTKLIMRPLCQDLARRGYAAWNVEYRRLGRDGGGWPMTFDDVAAAIDLLADLDGLDLSRVTLAGHSAGGQLALWAAGRRSLPPGSPGASPRVSAARVLALAAVCDIAQAGKVAVALLGGPPSSVPDRWAQADPMRRIPLDVPVCLVHGVDDATVSVQRSRDYAAAAAAAGAPVTLIETAGEHRAPIDPTTPAWLAAAGWLGDA